MNTRNERMNQKCFKKLVKIVKRYTPACWEYNKTIIDYIYNTKDLYMFNLLQFYAQKVYISQEDKSL